MKWFFLAFCLMLVVATNAQERILDFQSTVIVNKDRSVDVTEVVRVNVEGINIQRGIYRDIITTMQNEKGRRQRITLTVREVLKNNSPENFVTESNGIYTRIKIGSADVLLPNGEYTYTIKYNLNRQVRFFESYDEVYWNATGNGWMFEIEKASVRVLLPEEATISQHAGYSGESGATGCACSFTIESDHAIHYETTGSLYPYSGLTIAVGWQKGVIPPPTQEELEAEAFHDRKGIYYGIIGALIVLGYLMFAWFRVGIDPKKGSIIPRFQPPDGFSPAACRYVMKMSFDKKAFTASIVSMAVKGYLIIDKSEKNYALKKNSDSTEKLTAGEKKIAASLFAGTNTIVLSGTYISSLNTALSNLEDQLKTDFYKINFRSNYGWIIPAIILSIATVVVVMSTLMDDAMIFIPLVMSLFVMMFVSVIMVAGINSYRRSSGFAKILALFPTVIMPGFILGMPIYLLIEFNILTNDMVMIFGPYLLIFIGLIVMIFIFFDIIKAPTVFGRKRMDEIEGLRMFMNVAEKDRLNLLNPPEKTPQFFEQLLPYAIALDVENQWSQQFDAVIERAIQHKEYSPTWYVGDMRSIFNVHSISNNLGSSMSSAISNSSTPPSSSSSGSSGGGSSGGGGGGGGGGGW